MPIPRGANRDGRPAGSRNKPPIKQWVLKRAIRDLSDLALNGNSDAQNTLLLVAAIRPELVKVAQEAPLNAGRA